MSEPAETKSFCCLGIDVNLGLGGLEEEKNKWETPRGVILFSSHLPLRSFCVLTLWFQLGVCVSPLLLQHLRLCWWPPLWASSTSQQETLFSVQHYFSKIPLNRTRTLYFNVKLAEAQTILDQTTGQRLEDAARGGIDSYNIQPYGPESVLQRSQTKLHS